MGTKTRTSFDKLREMLAILSEPTDVMVEKNELRLMGIDEPLMTRLTRAPWISGASTTSHESSGAARVQAASAMSVDVGVTSSSKTSWPHSFSGSAFRQ